MECPFLSSEVGEEGKHGNLVDIRDKSETCKVSKTSKLDFLGIKVRGHRTKNKCRI